jgi:hypothetical protein
MFHALLLTAEIIGGVIAGLWIMAYGIAGVRRLLHGSDKLEIIDAAFIVKYEKHAAQEWWCHRVLVVFDIFCNVCCRGQQDETLSSRGYRAALEGKLWGRILSYWLSLIQVQHGAKAAVGDLERAEARVIINKKILGLE